MPSATSWATTGLSPLTRGNPPVSSYLYRAGTAYPRSRGGTATPDATTLLNGGLSPLTRGNLRYTRQRCPCPRPIPAHAGEPTSASAASAPPWAYPRSRGGTAAKNSVIVYDPGLSPLTRGNQWARQNSPARRGPIPAHAGEPSMPSRRPCFPRAYPRSRGGTSPMIDLARCIEGLSPLTRGNRPGDVATRIRSGPIPAHAGEPVCLR